MDVNEQIVATWAEKSQSLFLITELYFGNRHNDIDLLGVNLIKEEIWDIEVKVRTGSTNMCANDFNAIIDNFENEERELAIKERIGASKFPRKRILIISDSYLGRWEGRFREKGLEVIPLSKVMQDLLEIAKSERKSMNPIIQTLRLGT